jgi:hypothetical protein
MKAAKTVIVRLDGRSFMIEIVISEEDLVSTMIFSLGSILDNGFPLRVTRTSRQPLLRSQSMSSRILKSVPDLKE